MKLWINLSNGAICLRHLKVRNHHRFMRLQSAHLEQGLWDQIILGLPDELLLALALGEDCIIVDYGACRAVSRSLRQGIPFICEALSLRWFGIAALDKVPSYMADHIHHVAKNLSKSAKNKIDYYKDFIPERIAKARLRTIPLRGAGGPTDMDGKKDLTVKTIQAAWVQT